MASPQPEIRHLPLAALKLSNTSAQAERRAYLGDRGLAELAESIKAAGVLQPILVRPLRDAHIRGEAFEVVAGERRVAAARKARLEEIPATVRELTDEQVVELQLIENLQRADLHELAEAEGYEQLAKLGYSVDDIVVKVGKSRGTVYGRMKLLALSQEARKAFRAGTISGSVALLVARIPTADLQERALAAITEVGYRGRTMTYREAAEYVQETFMLRLSGAPFPREDETLVPSAGPCGACPMRTGNQPELFGDVKGADVCTNPECFASKKAAHAKRELEKAKATGERVIRGGEARRILPDRHRYWGEDAHGQLRNGYARPADKCPEDPKRRTYAELAGKDAPRVLLQNPDTGRVEKVFEISAIAEQLKAKGVTPPKSAKDSAEARERDQEQRELARKEELAARRAIFQACLKAAPAKLSRSDLEVLVAQSFDIGYDEDFYAALGWEMPKGAKGSVHSIRSREIFTEQLAKLSDAQLARVARVLPVVGEVLDVWGGKATALESLAKGLGIDVKKVRAAAAAPQAPKNDVRPRQRGKRARAK